MSMSGDGNIPETSMMALCANGGVAQQITGNALEWDFSNITTGKGLQIDMDGLTTGTGLEIRIDSDILTTGKALDIKAGSSMGTSSFSVGDTDTDGFVTITNTGSSLTATTAALLIKNTSALTTGAILRLQHDSASPATNDTIASIEIYADNTPGTATEYANIEFKSRGVTANVEESDIYLRNLMDGALNDTIRIQGTGGIVFQNPTTARDLVLKNTTAGSNGSGIRLYHNSASPATNDTIATIEAYGDNDQGTQTEMAHIEFKVTGVTTGSEASEIRFYHQIGSADTETLRLDANGLLIKSGGYIAGTATSANGVILKNLKNSAETNLTGTTQTVEIDLNGVSYYFTVYPSKDA